MIMQESSSVGILFKRYFPLAVFLLTWPFKVKQKPKLIYSEYSALQKIRVSDRSGLRYLQLGEGNTPIQACISLKKPQHLLLGCSRQMLAALYLYPSPQKILILGLGGGVLARTLGQLLPHSDITSVEIDPLVVKVAQTYFNFIPSSQQKVVINDGRQFIENAVAEGHLYDLIMLDAYEATYIPTRLMTIDFLQSVKALLAPDGVLAANTFSLSTLYHQESATYFAVFGEFYNLKFSNRIILAKKDGLPSLEIIEERAKTLEPQFKSHSINTPWLLDQFSLYQYKAPEAFILRDQIT